MNNLTGLFSATLQDIACQVSLEYQSGCYTGIFSADSEHLEIQSSIPNANGEFYGTIRSQTGENVASFHAVPSAQNILLAFAESVQDSLTTAPILFVRYNG